MTTATFRAVGFCAHYSKQGDWAFAFALDLSKKYSLKLNVFHFLEDPYDSSDTNIRHLTEAQLSNLAIERERELRLYYDGLAGDYLDIGFHSCPK
jgi:hypothetical protein